MSPSQTVSAIQRTFPFDSCGPLSAALMVALTQRPDPTHVVPVAEAVRGAVEVRDALRNEDFQLSLFLLYSLHYGSLAGADDEWEWDPDLLRARAALEAVMEAQLRLRVGSPVPPPATRDAVAEFLFALTAPQSGPSLSRDVAKHATIEQAHEFLMHRSIYTLREADPHSWAIPRLTGRPKAALVEIQSDEYGGGRPHRIHAELFARAMRGAGLTSIYGEYVDVVPAITLASLNMMSMFGLHRRLRGAIVGHLAAFEMTSSLPNRSYAEGFRRLGFGADVTDYFDEHVEADAVHEQIAGRDLAGSLVEDEPELVDDVVFGAAACLLVDGLVADHIRKAWEAGRSSLRSTGGGA